MSHHAQEDNTRTELFVLIVILIAQCALVQLYAQLVFQEEFFKVKPVRAFVTLNTT